MWLHDYCLLARPDNLYIELVRWSTVSGQRSGLMMEDQKEPLLTDYSPSLRSTLQELTVNIQLLYRKKLQMY